MPQTKEPPMASINSVSVFPTTQEISEIRGFALKRGSVAISVAGVSFFFESKEMAKECIAVMATVLENVEE